MPTNVSGALSQAQEAMRTGNYAGLAEQAKGFLQGNAGGLLLGGLAGLALGTKGGRSLVGTAAKLGVKRFRMNYFKYDLKQPIWEQLQAIRPKIKDLVALCKEIGIQPMFQNQS